MTDLSYLKLMIFRCGESCNCFRSSFLITSNPSPPMLQPLRSTSQFPEVQPTTYAAQRQSVVLSDVFPSLRCRPILSIARLQMSGFWASYKQCRRKSWLDCVMLIITSRSVSSCNLVIPARNLKTFWNCLLPWNSLGNYEQLSTGKPLISRAAKNS